MSDVIGGVVSLITLGAPRAQTVRALSRASTLLARAACAPCMRAPLQRRTAGHLVPTSDAPATAATATPMTANRAATAVLRRWWPGDSTLLRGIQQQSFGQQCREQNASALRLAAVRQNTANTLTLTAIDRHSFWQVHLCGVHNFGGHLCAEAHGKEQTAASATAPRHPGAERSVGCAHGQQRVAAQVQVQPRQNPRPSQTGGCLLLPLRRAFR